MRHPREQLAITVPYLSYLGLSCTCSSYIDYLPYCPLSKIYQEKRVVRYLLSSTHPFDILELGTNLMVVLVHTHLDSMGSTCDLLACLCGRVFCADQNATVLQESPQWSMDQRSIAV